MTKLLLKDDNGKKVLEVSVSTPAPKLLVYRRAFYKRSHFKVSGDAVYKPTLIHQVIEHGEEEKK